MADAKATFRLEGEDATAPAFRSALGNVNKFAEDAKKLLKGAFAVEIAVQVGEFVKGLAEMGEGLKKGAERAGIAQAQFNQLAAAFNETEVSVESLSKGIKNMQVAIAKASDGDKPLSKEFNDIGLSAASLKQLAPDVQLLAIAEALKNVKDPAERARAGMAILGKQFLELEPQMLKGAKGLDDMIQAAHGLSEDDVEKLSKFNEQLNRLWSNAKLLAAGGAAGIANFFTGLHDVVSPDLVARINQLQSALKNSGNFDESRLAQMRTELAALIAQRDALAKPSANVTAATDEQGKGRLEKLKATLDEESKLWAEVTQKWSADRKRVLDEEDAATRTSVDKRIEFERKVDDLISAGRISELEGIRRIDQAQRSADNAHAESAMIAQNGAAISASIKATEDDWRDAQAAMAEDSRIAQEANRKQFEETQQFARETSQAIEDTFAQAFETIGQGGLRHLVASFVQAFSQIVAKAEAMQLMKAMGLGGDGAGLSGLFGSLFGGGGSGLDSSTLFAGGNTADLASGFIPGFANGGSFQVGGAGGTDSQLVQFKASPNETVSITGPGQSQGASVHFAPVYNIGSGVSRAEVVAACQSTQRTTLAKISRMIKGGSFS